MTEPNQQLQRRSDEPPHDLLAEQCVLGAVMLSRDAILDVARVLRSGEDFYRVGHQAIWQAAVDLCDSGHPVEPVTVADELERHGELGRAGGAPYLHTLIATVPTAANAGWYAQIVRDKATVRGVQQAGQRIQQLGSVDADGPAEVAEIVELAQRAVAAVVDERASDDGALLDDLIQPTLLELDDIATQGHPKGVLTGFRDLDDVTNGLHPGQMVIVAARPGLGKSALGLDFARHCAVRLRRAAVIFSLEMGRSEIMMRLLAAESKVRLQDMRSGRMSDDDWVRVSKRVAELDGAPLIIEDSPSLTMTEIRARARRLKRRHDLALIVVDYLQLMSAGKRSESRQLEVSEFSRSLKLLAKELEVPVVAMSQLNRGPEGRADHRPMLSDLRETGSLEQDSDLVVLIHRPDAYDRDDPRAGEADLVLAKHRAGPTSTITVAQQLHYSRFVDLAAS